MLHMHLKSPSQCNPNLKVVLYKPRIMATLRCLMYYSPFSKTSVKQLVPVS